MYSFRRIVRLLKTNFYFSLLLFVFCFWKKSFVLQLIFRAFSSNQLDNHTRASASPNFATVFPTFRVYRVWAAQWKFSSSFYSIGSAPLSLSLSPSLSDRNLHISWAEEAKTYLRQAAGPSCSLECVEIGANDWRALPKRSPLNRIVFSGLSIFYRYTYKSCICT